MPIWRSVFQQPFSPALLTRYESRSHGPCQMGSVLTQCQVQGVWWWSCYFFLQVGSVIVLSWHPGVAWCRDSFFLSSSSSWVTRLLSSTSHGQNDGFCNSKHLHFFIYTVACLPFAPTYPISRFSSLPKVSLVPLHPEFLFPVTLQSKFLSLEWQGTSGHLCHFYYYYITDISVGSVISIRFFKITASQRSKNPRPESLSNSSSHRWERCLHFFTFTIMILPSRGLLGMFSGFQLVFS